MTRDSLTADRKGAAQAALTPAQYDHPDRYLVIDDTDDNFTDILTVSRANHDALPVLSPLREKRK